MTADMKKITIGLLECAKSTFVNLPKSFGLKKVGTLAGSISGFRTAILTAGLTPPDVIVADGRLRRFSSSGKSKDNAGWYVLHGDGIPAGSFGDWRTGLSQTWRAGIGRPLTESEESLHRTKVEAMRREREADEARRKAEAAKKAVAIWNMATPAPENHEYLIRKAIKPNGARLHEGALVIPMRIGDEIHSLQFIGEGARKTFLPGGRVKGCFFIIGTTDGATALCIAEGFATGASIFQATGYPVAVAFNAGNLQAVGKAMREKFPALSLILCADDDYRTDGNPGLSKATETARSVSGLLAIPDFGAERPDGSTDFNDLAQLRGAEAVKQAILSAVSAVAGDPQPSTENKPTGNHDAWPEPQPIPCSLLPVEAFDNDLLPAALRPWVADIAERMQCPPDFPAVGAMVALSSVIGCKACIRPKRHDNWQVVPNLWGAIVGRPGVMKSPALSEVMKPLDRLAIAAGEIHAEAMRDYEIKSKIEGMSSKTAEAQAQKLVAKGNLSGAEQLLIDAADAEADTPPPLRRYKVTDASVEALGEILIENPWGTLAYRDELNGLLRSLDREGQEGSRAFYLQGYDGNQGYTFDRIMRGRNLHIPAVCISMLGGIQPGKLQSYIHDAVSGGAGDDGLLQRFGLLVWPDVCGEWRNVDRWPDTPAKSMAFETFQRLDAMLHGTDPETGEDAPVVYRFSPEAQILFEEWRQEFETALRSGSYHPAMESHLSKYRKLVPAVALVCALADGESEVSRDSLLRALAWSDYLQSHATRAYAAGTRPATEGATALLAKIKAGAVADGFKPADVYLKGWAHLATPEDAHAAIARLCDLQYLQMSEKRPGSSGGRPSITYRINPATMGV